MLIVGTISDMTDIYSSTIDVCRDRKENIVSLKCLLISRARFWDSKKALLSQYFSTLYVTSI